MWLRVGLIAMHSIDSTLSDSLINSIFLFSKSCLTIVFPTVYTIFIWLSSSMIPI